MCVYDGRTWTSNDGKMKDPIDLPFEKWNICETAAVSMVKLKLHFHNLVSNLAFVAGFKRIYRKIRINFL